MAKKKVCVSFDFEHDHSYYLLLKAWDANANFEFSFHDCTPKEIQSESVTKIKQVLSTKIGEANYMIAIIGEHSDEEHPDHEKIEYNNWQAYEIAKNREKNNGLVVVKLDKSYSVPDEAKGIGAEYVYGFKQNEIIDALNKLVK